MTTNFEIGKTYKRRDGVSVVIKQTRYYLNLDVYTVDGDDGFCRWDSSGRLDNTKEDPRDLILPSLPRSRGPLKIK